jgi:hypothetical protein
MFVIVLWKLVVVVGPRRTSKEFSRTRFASFTMSLKIKKLTISDDDQVLEFSIFLLF